MAKAKGAKADRETGHWKDRGCKLWNEPSCLDCHHDLSECPNEVPALKRLIKQAKQKQAVLACRVDGLTIKQIAKTLNMSSSTVIRALER